MNYRKHYNALMTRARNRVLDGYFEKHHVKPKCLGGPDRPDNIVCLTAEEHFVAHLILAKLYPANIGILSAVMLMSRSKGSGPRKNNKAYGWIRKLVSASKRGMTHTPEARAKISKVQKGRKRDAAWVEKMRAINTGRKRPPETGARISAALKITCNTPEYKAKISKIHTGRKHTAQTRLNMRNAHLGYVPTEEHRKNLSLAGRGKKRSPEVRAKYRETALNRSRQSQYMGITKNKKAWTAQIRNGKKNRYLGSFKTEIEAAIAYDRAAREQFGPTARINFPTEVAPQQE